LTIRVYYEDTDVGGVVYHSNYLNFCERARSDMFFKEKLSPISNGSHFVVKNLTANYIKSAFFGDILNVETGIKRCRSASILLQQTIYKNSEEIFSMEIELVFMQNQKISKIPESIKDIFMVNKSLN